MNAVRAAWISFAAVVLIAPSSIAQPKAASDDFVSKVNEAYATKATAKDMEGGVPTILLKPIEQRYAKAKDKYVGLWKSHAADFEKAWGEYATRKTACEAAITGNQGKKSDEAKKALIAVITPNKTDEGGKIDLGKRHFIEPVDGEVPCIVALAKLWSSDKDYVAAASIPPMLHGRRNVGDKDDERLLWLAYEKRKETRELGEMQKKPAGDAFAELIHRSDKAFDERAKTGRTMLKAFPGLGPKFVEPWDAHDAKKGDWVFMRIKPTKIDDKMATYVDQGEYEFNTNCKETSEVIGWDPVFGKWIYKTKCDTKTVKENIDVKVTFAKPPPAWAKSADSLWIVAKVSSVGPKKWILTDGGVADWRFLGLLGM